MRKIKPVLFIIGAFLLSGCYKIAPPVYTLNEAHKKFLRIAKEDFNLNNVVLKPLENTIYIYLPLDKEVIAMQSKMTPPPPPNTADDFHQINFFDGEFIDNNFTFEYDIIPNQKYPPKDLGVGNNVTEEFTRKQNHIMLALKSAYADLEHVPGDVDFADGVRDLKRDRLVRAHVNVDKAPDFVVLTVADVKKGILIEMIFSLKDHRAAFSGELSGEEYQRRMLTEVRGDPTLMDDYEGRGIEPKEVLWPEFLTKQIVNRVKSIFAKNEFQQEVIYEDEILLQVSNTTRYYDYKKYGEVQLTDLRTEQSKSFTPDQVKTYKED